MAMMQGSNKPKKDAKPMGGPPVEMMTPEVLAPPTGWRVEKPMWPNPCKFWYEPCRFKFHIRTT